MRRSLFRLLLCLALLACFVQPVAALEEKELFEDFFAALPESVEKELANATTPTAAAELVGVEYLFSLCLSFLEGEFSASFPFFMRMLGIALLMALLDRLQEALGSSGTAAACGAGVILVLLLFRTAEADLGRVTTTLADMRALSDGLLPVFASLFVSGGSATTATAASGGFAALSYLLEHVVAALLLPLLRVLFAFSVISAVGSRSPLLGLFSALRQIYITALGFLGLLLGASLGFQTTLTAAADSLAAHSARFAVGNLIPVIGNSLSGSLRTLAASLTLLKSTVGILAVVAILLLFLPGLCSLLLHRFFFSLTAGLSAALGSRHASQIFADFRAIYDLAIATLAIASVLFLLIIGILTRCGVAAGGMGG